MKQYLKKLSGPRLLVLASFLALCASSAFAKKEPTLVTLELSCSARPVMVYGDIKTGLSLIVKSDVNKSDVVDESHLNEKLKKKFNRVFTTKPDIDDFVEESLIKFIKAQGISYNSNRATDFLLKVTVREFKVVDSSDGYGEVKLDYSLIDPQNRTVLQQTAKGRSNLDLLSLPNTLDKAYSNAVEDMDWISIIRFLKEGSEEQKTNKQVAGKGDTDLEHTIIRWYIVSTPGGADVSWRVVSSTQDVKNTNSNYVGTTPYETTESFDIKGLNHENAGNIQIEITCEKAGYITQKKRFNVKQAIDQKEISAKFNLVKEDSTD